MITLGIETSCDETAAAVVKDGRVLSNTVSSSVHLHSPYGGVVPEIASRLHTSYISTVFKNAVRDASCRIEDIDLVVVTGEPGLPGSLLVGKTFARAISLAVDIPLVIVDHLHAHILSCFLQEGAEISIKGAFPFVGAVISGGHTGIYLCKGIGNFKLIGRTKDDAVGEAFDKVAKLLGLGYPGGAIVEEYAGRFKGPDEIKFPRALLSQDNLDFSFSGIKTAVMYYWRASDKTEKEKVRICFSFQEAVIDVLDKKITRAIHRTGAQRLAVGGGVINNTELRRRLTERCAKEKIKLYLPPKEYCTDNAAMVAALGEAFYKTKGIK